MVATSAAIGMQSTFSIGNGTDGGSTTYAVVGVEITNITSPALTREAIDTTHLGSPENAREFIAGLLDGEPCTISFNYLPSASDPLLIAMLAGKGDFQITYPNGVRLQFSGIPTNWKPGDASTTTMAGEFTVKPSGTPELLTAI